MSKRMKYSLLISAIPILISLFTTACSSFRYFVEKPDYKVLQDDGKLEIRRYVPTVVAEVEADGERFDAVNKSFSPLADYIFGANTKGQKIAMTSPVSQKAESEKIAMTSPVTQQPTGEGKWTVQFTMPSKYKLADLPEPKNPAVKLREVPSRTFAVYRFNGSIEKSDFNKRLETLRNYMNDKNLEAVGEPTFAYYDPPWTLPFLRRNEILIEITSDSAI